MPTLTGTLKNLVTRGSTWGTLFCVFLFSFALGPLGPAMVLFLLFFWLSLMVAYFGFINLCGFAAKSCGHVIETAERAYQEGRQIPQPEIILHVVPDKLEADYRQLQKWYEAETARVLRDPHMSAETKRTLCADILRRYEEAVRRMTGVEDDS